MSSNQMHADEVPIDAALVRRLLREQFPDWGELPLEPVLPMGTDNALFRLGDELVVRLPRRERTAVTLEKERLWLPWLAPLLPVAVPVPVADGAPDCGFPFVWFVYSWLAGETATDVPTVEPARLAAELARFVATLHGLDPAGGPAPGAHNFFRGEPLPRRDAATRTAIAKLAGRIDAAAATAVWEEALGTPEWRGPPVWVHGDLDSRNLLLENGRLSAVLDWGGLGVGDPACDVMVAWKVLSEDARQIFRSTLGVDDETWTRARGWALSQAVGVLSYYTLETNPVLVREGERWLAEVLAPPA